MKSFVRVPVHKESSESRMSRLLFTVSGTWEFNVTQDQYLNGHERQ